MQMPLSYIKSTFRGGGGLGERSEFMISARVANIITENKVNHLFNNEQSLSKFDSTTSTTITQHY